VWERFEAALGRIPAATLGRPRADADAWSVADVAWHVAWWCDEAARVLRAMGDGSRRDGDLYDEPGRTDRVNRRERERSRTMPVEDAIAACPAARRRMLEAFGALAEAVPEAEEWFAESGPEHYAEHVPDLEALAASG
jgi:hypothetical protein